MKVYKKNGETFLNGKELNIRDKIRIWVIWQIEDFELSHLPRQEIRAVRTFIASSSLCPSL